MASLKIQKLSKRIKERVGFIFLNEINDPRLGRPTVTRVDLARDLRSCTIYYSVLGEETEQRTTERALEAARGYVQRKVAEILSTRNTPILTFKFDRSIAGSVRIGRILEDLARERGEGPEDAAGESDESENESEASESGPDPDANDSRTDERG